MTQIKLDSTVANAALDALTPHVGRLYSSLGTRIVVIAELASTIREQPAPNEEKKPSVKLQVKHLEVATSEAEGDVRRALLALHTQRTAYGTLTEDQEVELSARTLAELAGNVNATEAARLHVGIERWTDYAGQAVHNSKLTASEVRQEFRTVTEALRALIFPDTIKAKD